MFVFLSVRLSVFPSLFLDVLLELDHQFFLNFGILLETHFKLCVTELDFFKNIFLPKKGEKYTQNGPAIGSFEFIEKFGH